MTTSFIFTRADIVLWDGGPPKAFRKSYRRTGRRELLGGRSLGDLDVTLNWRPDTEFKLVYIDDEVSSHALISGGDNSSVRVIPTSNNWPVKDVKTMLKDG